MWKSKYTNGEKCRCGDDAIAKVGEEIMNDDPFQNRHNLTAYVCEKHFRELFGDFGVDFTEEARIQDIFEDFTEKLSGDRGVNIIEDLKTDQVLLKDFMEKK